MVRYMHAPLCLIFLFSCGRTDRRTAEPGAAPAAAIPGQVPDHAYARNFTIDYFDRYKEVKILNHSAASPDTLDFLLLPAWVPVPRRSRPRAGDPDPRAVDDRERFDAYRPGRFRGGNKTELPGWATGSMWSTRWSEKACSPAGCGGLGLKAISTTVHLISMRPGL